MNAAAPSHAFLAKLTCHTDLSEAERSAVMDLISRPISVPAGAVVAAVGDPLDVATLTLQGLVARTKVLADGRRQILAILLPGDLVDGHASPMPRRDDGLEALETSTVAIIPQSRIAALVKAFPRLQDALIKETLLETAIAREWVLNVGRRTALEGCAHLLCELTQRMDAVGLKLDERYPFKWRQQQLADCLGLSSIHMNRVLQALRKRGCIKLDREGLEILDRPQLCKIGGFDGAYLAALASPAARP